MNYFEQNGIPYELHSDGFYYPKLAMPEQKPAHYGRYGHCTSSSYKSIVH